MKSRVTLVLVFLVLSGPAWAANDFSEDANCVALYRFESGALGTDTLGNNTMNYVDDVDANATDYQEGAASAYFNSDESDYMTIYENNISADFPGKSESGNTTWSACCWFKNTVPRSAGQYTGLLSKMYASDGARAWEVGLNYDSGDGHIDVYLAIGYADGNEVETAYHATAIDEDKWYHIGVTFNDSTKKGTIRIWDETGQQIVGTDLDNTFTNNMYCGDSEFQIGRRCNNTGRDFWGDIDEAVVFNDVLTTEQIDMIRNGTYPTGGEETSIPIFMHHYRSQRP